MKNVTVSPSNYSENYPFPAGKHRVMWTGISDSGSLKSCSFHITVNGKCLAPTRCSEKRNSDAIVSSLEVSNLQVLI